MAVQIDGSQGSVIATSGTYSGGVSIGGTLTYEDVTNIDAVGLITARSGIEVGASPGVGASISVDGNAIFAGIGTFGSISSPTLTGDVSIADKIIHTGDTNTAIRFPSADTINLETGGSVRLQVNSSGKVQLSGTRNGALQPEDDDTLQLFTKSADNSINRGSGITFYNHDNSGYEMGGTIQVAKENGTADDEAAYMRFSTRAAGAAAQERLRITSDGYLKHTGLRSGNSQNKLAILVTPSYNTAEEDVIVYQVENESGSNQLTFGGGTGSYNAATTLRFLTAAVNTTGGDERLRITSGGAVQVNGGAVHLDASGELAVFETDTNLAFTNSAKLAFDFSSNIARVRTSGNGSFTTRPLAFYTGNDERLRIGTTGTIEIKGNANGLGSLLLQDNNIGGHRIEVADETISGAIYLPRDGVMMLLTGFSNPDSNAMNYPQPNVSGLVYIDCGPSRRIDVCDLGTAIGVDIVGKAAYTSTVADCDNNKLTVMAGSTEGTFHLCNRSDTNKYLWCLTFL